MNGSGRDQFSLLGSGASLLVLGAAFYYSFLVAPTEASMSMLEPIQRIFYIHLPSAFICFLGFFTVFVASLGYLGAWAAVLQMLRRLWLWVLRRPYQPPQQITRRLEWDWLAVSAAEVGVVFCAAVLITGPLWAKPVWGLWWTWDARLTTTLILFLIYVGYLMLRVYVTEAHRRALLAAVVGILGFVDVPIVYMANRWWRTQHPQPVIAGGESSGLDPRMWLGVLGVFAGLLLLASLLVWQRYRLEAMRAELIELEREARS